MAITIAILSFLATIVPLIAEAMKVSASKGRSRAETDADLLATVLSSTRMHQ